MKFFSIVILIVISSVGCATENNPCLKNFENLYSTYQIYKVDKFGGGLTTDEQVKEYKNKEVVISRETFKVRNVSLINPVYKTHCFNGVREGEVDTHRWANFYGYGMNRDIIKVLEVYDSKETSSEPEFMLEIIGDNELWEMYDGWIYMMHKK